MNEQPLILLSTVCGHIAMWAARQSPYHAPDALTEVLKQFQISVANEECHEKHLSSFWLRLDATHPAQHLRKILKEHLFADPNVRAWNERKNGNQSPYGFCSRYDRPDPDNDFIDLDALVGNIANTCIQEYRRSLDEDRRCFNPSLWRRINSWLKSKSPSRTQAPSNTNG